MRSRAESKETDPLSRLNIAQLERAITNDPRTAQRGGLLVRYASRDGQNVGRFCQHVFGITAIAVETGEAGIRAQVLLPMLAEPTGAVCPTQPGHANPVALCHWDRQCR